MPVENHSADCPAARKRNPLRGLRALPTALLDSLAQPRRVRWVGRRLFGVRAEETGVGPDVARCRRILVMRTDHIGDFVLSSAFLRELRRAAPGAEITIVVSPATHGLAERCPYVDRALVYHGDDTGATPLWRRAFDAARFARSSLLHCDYDLALLPRWDRDHDLSTYVARFSGAQTVIAFSESVNPGKAAHSPGLDALVDVPLSSAPLGHEAERGLEMLRQLGCEPASSALEVWTDADDERWAGAELGALDALGPRPRVALCASGGGSHLKAWPPDRFREVAMRIVDDRGAAVVAVGGPNDVELSRGVTEGLGPAAISTAGRATVRQTAALIRRCDAFLGNDAGLTHVAAACGVPVVALFGASCPHRFAPIGQGVRVIHRELPCSPCGKAWHDDSCTSCPYGTAECMRRISVEEVMDTLLNVLAAPRPTLNTA